MDRRSFVKSMVAGFLYAAVPKGTPAVVFLDEPAEPAPGAPGPLQILDWSIDVSNNARVFPLGSLGEDIIRFGRMDYTGTIKVYAEGDGWEAIWNDLLSMDTHDVELPVADAGFWKGKVKFTEASIHSEHGMEAIAELNFIALGGMEWSDT